MYDIRPKHFLNYSVYKTKNSKNQTLELCISRKDHRSHDWFVCFYITTKRKQGFQENVSTGKDGLSSLLWAKRCLIDWIEEEKNSFFKNKERWKTRLYIYATDKRRKEAYRYGLRDLGFEVEKSKEAPLYLWF